MAARENPEHPKAPAVPTGSWRVDRGATGFWEAGGKPLPSTDLSRFRAACFAAARTAGGHVGVLTRLKMATFHAVTITGAGWSRAVLCHAHLSVVAFPSAPPQGWESPRSFDETPGWAEQFTLAGFRALGRAELATPVEELDLSHLARVERAQVRHWRPATLGELLFNCWD
ncbi:hypothetical protein VSH64_05540 [Amycolatopsis rhabdoformis]|uniref:Uncharacterized protein n=1 Tax=Amycolatopsis rhabdoformis TaxID=1448059 RepID=A0ABZ1ICW5_9PSEU|nr:hypothetical protein [Amycolatopsis rhabdoformis]WSE31571.1 hypothetical protein VSH64_05540 [Amycolatopsis rhabdoformis]